MKKDMGINGRRGAYVATIVMVGGGKWYLRCFRCGMVSFVFFYFLLFFIGVEVMCMGRSVRDVSFRACLWIEFLIFVPAFG